MRMFGPEPLFRDRQDAGRALAARLERYRGRDPLVLGLPRGGVVVAAEVARRLDAELDVVVARKLGAPSLDEARHVGVRDAGSDRVDPNAAWAPRGGEVFHERVDRALRSPDHGADLLGEPVRPVRRRKIRGTFRHLPVDRTITASRSLE